MPCRSTFVWSKTDARPMFNSQMPPRTCVDFDGLVASIEDRKVDVEEIQRLKNPLLSNDL